MSNNPNSVVVWGGGANKPLINFWNTLNTLKNSNPKELAKNLKKIQNSNQLDLNHLNELKDLKSDSNLKSTFKESTIKSVMDKNQTSNKQNKNLNEIQEINYSRDSNQESNNSNVHNSPSW